MRLIATDLAPDGVVVARDVRAVPTDAIPLLGRGTPLRSAYRQALARAGVTRIFIEDDLSEGIAPAAVLPDPVRARAVRAVAEILGEAAGAHRRQKTLTEMQVAALTPIAQEIILEVHRAGGDVTPTFGDVAGAAQYLPSHCVDLCTIGVMVAMRHNRVRGWRDRGALRYEVNDQAVQKLAVALLLLDVGKVAIPQGLLEHGGPLDATGRKTIYRHPELGDALLPQGSSFVTHSVVRHHHERWDGTGYPNGESGQQISFEARIANIADVFDAVMSNRFYADAGAQHEAWSVIINGAGGAFDPDIVEIFREIVLPYPPGVDVRLPDGRVGVVASASAADPLRPVVRVLGADGAVEELTGMPVQPPHPATDRLQRVPAA